MTCFVPDNRNTYTCSRKITKIGGISLAKKTKQHMAVHRVNDRMVCTQSLSGKNIQAGRAITRITFAKVCADFENSLNYC